MTEKTTTIRGYTITLETDMNGDGGGVTGCWIERGDASASLESAEATGGLCDYNDNVLSVPTHTLRAIRAWADANGY
jgi:hypothetical protein